jgi:tRNA threonylcarbamoyladenosine modification (KEOPS) complex Cgi121 subunit
MIKRVEGFSKWAAIAGLRDVYIGDVEGLMKRVRGELEDVAVQFFDAKCVAGWEHLYFAVLNALRAFESGTNVSKSLAVECLLYASAQRQIKSALSLVGVKRGCSQVAVLAVADGKTGVERALARASELVGGCRDDGVIELLDEKVPYVLSLFSISDLELKAKLGSGGVKRAVADLVVEHVALLAVQR